MNVKSLIAVSALTLASFGIASAKSYDFVLTSPTLAGATQLKPGQYKVKVQGSQAIFTDEQTAKSVSVPVTVKQAETKFDHTAVKSSNSNGTDTIQTIELGGSNTLLELGH